jgi:hypothetical protein
MLPPELEKLMQRFNQIGRLLPQDDGTLDLQDVQTRAHVELLLAELTRVKTEIDSFLDTARS